MKITILEIFVIVGIIQWVCVFLRDFSDVITGDYQWNYISLPWIWFYFSIMYIIKKFYHLSWY